MSPLGLNPSEPPGTGAASLTVADILGRGVVVEWYEAVAVVRAVAELSAGNVRAIPELNQIGLDPTGVVHILGTAGADEPIRRLGQLLQALIAQADAPVQLRLMITQATAPAPLFASIQEYSEALGYFERPNRTAVLRALYERAAAARPLADPVAVPTLDDVAPLPESPPAKPPRERKRDAARTSRIVRAAAAIAIVASAAGGGLWLLKRQRVSPPTRSQMTDVAGQATEKLGNAVVSGVSAVTEKLGLGRIVPADAPADAPPPTRLSAPVPEPKPEKHARKKPEHTVGARVMPGMAFDLAGTAGITGALSDVIYDGVVTDSNSDEPTSDNSITYGPGSDGVVPPVAVEPRLPQKLPPDVDAQRLGRIVLVIAVDGSVESVKLVGPPRNVHDAMFLSVAKAWQFQPALKDGVPVRYRKMIWIASQ